MKKSNFQFSDPKIKKITFMVNDDEVLSNEMPISIEVESEMLPFENEAIVGLTLSVGEYNEEKKTPNTSIYFNGIICAKFRWEDNVRDPESMLKINGGSVLLSYIRPVLANLTMQAGIRPLNLPFVNFTES